jgi:hypothetical protein
MLELLVRNSIIYPEQRLRILNRFHARESTIWMWEALPNGAFLFFLLNIVLALKEASEEINLGGKGK